MPKFEGVNIDLQGQSGDSSWLMSRASRAMRRSGATEEEIKTYLASAAAGDYEHALSVTMEYVNVR